VSAPSADKFFVAHRVYFSADDGVHGTDLWVTDGTEEGTQLFADINPDALRSSPQSFKVAGGAAFLCHDRAG
jgi:ELWxxDGT repeat protein